MQAVSLPGADTGHDRPTDGRADFHDIRFEYLHQSKDYDTILQPLLRILAKSLWSDAKVDDAVSDSLLSLQSDERRSLDQILRPDSLDPACSLGRACDSDRSWVPVH